MAPIGLTVTSSDHESHLRSLKPSLIVRKIYELRSRKSNFPGPGLIYPGVISRKWSWSDGFVCGRHACESPNVGRLISISYNVQGDSKKNKILLHCECSRTDFENASYLSVSPLQLFCYTTMRNTEICNYHRTFTSIYCIYLHNYGTCNLSWRNFQFAHLADVKV